MAHHLRINAPVGPLPNSLALEDQYLVVSSVVNGLSQDVRELREKYEGTALECIDALAEDNRKLMSRLASMERRLVLHKPRGSTPGKKGLASIQLRRKMSPYARATGPG